jgi:predicted NAD-dependent protein-ADP-ribosyltransferase YbiA (DUF1768 family)
MDTSSFFIKDKALFGSFPSQESVLELEQKGVRYFIDLTTPEEKETKITQYTTKYEYINYPIVDRNIPTNWYSYAFFIIKICNLIKYLKVNEKIYIGCRGGHGRSGVVTASILCHMFGLSPEESLEYTTKCHSNRKTLKDKWRKIGSPQTFMQKKFIYKFFAPLKFYRTVKYVNTTGFSNFSNHSVYIEGIGTFPTSESAYQAHKNLEDYEYVKKQLNSKTPLLSIYYGDNTNICSNWDSTKFQILEMITQLKFDQHEEIRMNLMNTGLRPLIDCTYKFRDVDRTNNIMGEILTRIRNKYYQQLEDRL